MTTVAITGFSGLIGWHLRCYLYAQQGFEVVPVRRAAFHDLDSLSKLLARCDAVVHLAGATRDEEAAVVTANLELAHVLAGACSRAGRPLHILYANSVQIYENTSYGWSKEEAGAILAEWTALNGGCYTNVVLPRVFGEHGRPFHNSVVSTLCHQVATGIPPTVHSDATLELIHAQRVAAAFTDAIRRGDASTVRLSGNEITVSALAGMIQDLASQYRANLIPALSSDFAVALFNTLRSYLYPRHYPVRLDARADARGRLVEVARSETPGQTFFSTTTPGSTRGQHYHLRKLERFMVVEGTGLIRIRRMFYDEVHEFKVSGDAPQYIDMPTGHTHSIINVGDSDLLTIFWVNEVYNPDDPDTVFAPV